MNNAPRCIHGTAGGCPRCNAFTPLLVAVAARCADPRAKNPIRPGEFGLLCAQTQRAAYAAPTLNRP